MKDVLLIMARAPELGQCKTRLIPQLGPLGATELHAHMTHHALAWGRILSRASNITVEVHFSGGSALEMAETFGHDLEYIPQVAGDLGIKLKAALGHQRVNKAGRLVVVGTDCPQLTAEFVESAFARLNDHDVCLAPAEDGGYVLLGVNLTATTGKFEPLFETIQWGSSNVLTQTLTQIESCQFTCALLPTLSDVDTPDDLDVWRQVVDGVVGETPKISVIIPTFHEEPQLNAAIDSALVAQTSEVIVVASGRFGESLRVAAEKRVQCLVSNGWRSQRLNIGASLAVAETLLFLHADTLLPDGYAATIERLLQDAQSVGGAFQLHIDSPFILARMVEYGVRWRSRWQRLPYGDQALFVRKAAFDRLQGFKSQPIMEDYEFIRRLRRVGRITMSSDAVQTSARRWHRRGFARTSVINQCMLLGYHLGVPLEKLKNFYRGDQHK